MAKLGNILVASALTVGGAILLYKLFNKTSGLALLANKFDYNVNLKKPYFSGTTLILPFDIVVNNPTKTPLTFEKPYIEVFFNNGSSDVRIAHSKSDENKDASCEILPQSKSFIKDIKIEIPIISNFSIFKDIIMKLIPDADTISQTGWLALPSLISANIDKLLPYFSVDVMLYVGETPINKKIQLG